MEVEGSFDNWTTRQNMQRSGKDFTIVKLLPPGVYQVSTLHACSWPTAGAMPRRSMQMVTRLQLGSSLLSPCLA